MHGELASGPANEIQQNEWSDAVAARLDLLRRVRYVIFAIALTSGISWALSTSFELAQYRGLHPLFQFLVAGCVGVSTSLIVVSYVIEVRINSLWRLSKQSAVIEEPKEPHASVKVVTSDEGARDRSDWKRG